MSKAGNAFRRSGVYLKSLGSSHSELKILINQLKETRSVCKSLAVSNQAASQDLVKWSEQEESRAIKDTVARVGEMMTLYTDIQRVFADRLKEFRTQFENILDGEQQVDLCKSKLDAAQEKETRCRKELKRVSKRRSSSAASGNSPSVSAEVREWNEKLTQAEKEKDLAQIELNERLREHEAIKMIRLKDGLLKWSSAHLDVAAKSQVIFQATQDVAKLIPDAPISTDIQHIPYTGGAKALEITMVAKELLQMSSPSGNGTSQLTASSTSTSMASLYYPPGSLPQPTPQAPNLYPPIEQPPPYAEIQPPHNPYLYNSSPNGAHDNSFYSNGNLSYNRSHSSSAIPNLDNSNNATAAAPPTADDPRHNRRRSDQSFFRQPFFKWGNA